MPLVVDAMVVSSLFDGVVDGCSISLQLSVVQHVLSQDTMVIPVPISASSATLQIELPVIEQFGMDELEPGS